MRPAPDDGAVTVRAPARRAAATDLGYCYWPYQADLEHWFCKPSAAHRTHPSSSHADRVPAVGSGDRLRNYLRAHRETAGDYTALKQRLAREHRLDWEAYTVAKRPFMDRITELALRSAGRNSAQGIVGLTAACSILLDATM
jgi:GrpB-like predicted nucleotidyltransferase (UPF0157 family)